jgi:hypothetical protein
VLLLQGFVFTVFSYFHFSNSYFLGILKALQISAVIYWCTAQEAIAVGICCFDQHYRKKKQGLLL